MEPKEEIKQRIDVVDLIQEYIQMKPAGTHAFKAVCPFHTEKTPSFHVSRDKQIWRCFGCGLGGDIFSFVMQMDGIDFPEAMRLLGKKAGVEVQRYDTSEANEKARCQRVQNFAAAFYHKILLESQKAMDARAYVERRNIPHELVEKFQLGFAPDEWDAFVVLAKSRSISDRDLTTAGLALPRKTGQGMIDRFRNRLMIPLTDVHGNILGFTGRDLTTQRPNDSTTSGPKYMNSPETVLYKKSAVLFGLHLAKQAIRRENAVIIVEGNLDVIASHKASVEHVVASSGTALTELQIQLLKRFTTKLLFCFDADVAGFAAAQRGIAIAQKLGCDVSVVLIPEGAGKDPDDVVQKQPELWRELVHSTVPIMEYYFTQALKGKDLMKVEDKRAVGNFLLPQIAGLTDVIEREHWLQKLGMLLHVETEVLRGTMGKGTDGTKGTKGTDGTKEKVVLKKDRKSRRELVAEEVLGLFIEVPEFRAEIQQKLTPATLPTQELQDLYRTASDLYTQTQSSATQSFFEQLRDQQLSLELKNLLERLAITGEQAAMKQALTEVRTQLEPMIDFLRQVAQEDERRVVLASIRQAEAAGDREHVKELMQQLHKLR